MRKKLTLLFLSLLLGLTFIGCQTTTASTSTLTSEVPATFALSTEALTMAVGSAAQLMFETNAMITAANPAVYQISDPMIASINQEGAILALASGSAVITLSYLGEVVATCAITVAHDIEITLPRKAIYALGESLNLRDAAIRLLASDGSTLETVPITAEMIVSGDLNASGERLIGFEYQGVVYQFAVLVLSQKQAAARFDDFILLDETALTQSKLEFAFTKADFAGLEDAIDNVYDYDEIHLYVKFISPSGKVLQVDAFWYQAFTEQITVRNVNPSNNLEGTVTTLPTDYRLVLDYVASGNPEYRVRYLTEEAGIHTAEVYVAVDGALIQTMTRTFDIAEHIDPTYQGVVKIDSTNSRHFVFSSGKTYMPIGQNVAWYTSKDRKYYDYLTWFSKMGEVGANYARVWLAAWGFSPFWDDVYNYDSRLSNLVGLDETLASAEENGIYIQLTLLHHGMFSALVNPMWPNTANTWYTSKYGANPYADILTNPAQFFTADVAKDAFQDMLQYIVARYGYSDHLMAWELFNEVDWVEGYAAISGAAWHKQMAEFIQSVDPYDHLVTTSVKGDSFTSAVYNVFRLSAIDYVNVHRYGISDHVATLPGRQTAGFAAFGKPIFYSEIGTSGNGGQDQIAIDPDHSTLHDALWGGMMGGGAGGGANWWWESWIHPADAYYIYQGAAAYAAKLDLSGDYSLLSQIGFQVGNSALKAIGYAVDNRLYAYFYGAGQTTFSAPIANGSYTISFYSTTTGALLSQSTQTVANGILQVAVPTFVKDVAMIVQ